MDQHLQNVSNLCIACGADANMDLRPFKPKKNRNKINDFLSNLNPANPKFCRNCRYKFVKISEIREQKKFESSLSVFAKSFIHQNCEICDQDQNKSKEPSEFPRRELGQSSGQHELPGPAQGSSKEPLETPRKSGRRSLFDDSQSEDDVNDEDDDNDDNEDEMGPQTEHDDEFDTDEDEQIDPQTPTPSKYKNVHSPKTPVSEKISHKRRSDVAKKTMRTVAFQKLKDGEYKELTFLAGNFSIPFQEFVDANVAYLYACTLCRRVCYKPIYSSCGHLYCTVRARFT